MIELISKFGFCYSTSNNEFIIRFSGHLEVVKLLIQKGAMIDASEKNRNTALIWSASNGHIDVVKFLIDNGASIEKVLLCFILIIKLTFQLRKVQRCKTLHVIVILLLILR